MENEFSPNIPIYIPVMEYIKKEIVTGRLAPGDKIPAVRELASESKYDSTHISRARTRRNCPLNKSYSSCIFTPAVWLHPPAPG